MGFARIRLAALLVALFAMGSVTVSHANLIVNGGFENNTSDVNQPTAFPGWSDPDRNFYQAVFDPSSCGMYVPCEQFYQNQRATAISDYTWVPSSASSYAGSAFAACVVGGCSDIFQNVSTTAGENYVLSFASKGNVTVTLERVTSMSFSSADWTVHTLSFTALDRSSRIAFSGDAAGIDEVSFATAAVPQPSTWVMMILGFAGVGFMSYRYRGRSGLGGNCALG